MHMRDPVKFSLRELARLFHMSIGRVDAILRMKGMEKDWVKVRILFYAPPSMMLYD